MPAPNFSEAMERFYDRLPAHYRAMDERQDYVLKKFFAGALQRQQDIDTLRDAIEYDSERDPSDLSALIDVSKMPAAWLNWRAQLSGIYNLSMFPIEQRRQVLNQIGYNGLKGTAQSMARAVQPFLVGSRYVNVFPRTADATAIGAATMWDVLIVTRGNETLSNNAPRVFAEANVPSIWQNNTPNDPKIISAMDSRFGEFALEIEASAAGSVAFGTKRVAGRRITATGGDPYVVFLDVLLSDPTDPPSSAVASIVCLDNAGAAIGSPISVNMVGTLDASGQLPKQLSAPFTTPVGTVEVQTSFVIAGINPASSVRFGRFGVRLGIDTQWVAETIDVPEIVAKANVKPAGVTIHHETYETDWNTIESEIPTWNDWEALTFDEIEGLGLT